MQINYIEKNVSQILDTVYVFTMAVKTMVCVHCVWSNTYHICISCYIHGSPSNYFKKNVPV